ncbi:DUF4079 domain-containing protein [Baaleninema sp.]|uniref:DUF4079 domain-containing protein n=1 Tax=Baaleninema sp. TaxID=3101197 RepID=UPI003D04DC4E
MNPNELLEPIAAPFRDMGIPDVVTQWGHPVMMGIVVVVMGSFVAWTGWRGRLAEDKETSMQSRSSHRKLAPLMEVFMFLGYTGGVLSLAIQKEPVFSSPHFWTGTMVLVLLFVQGISSRRNFWGNNADLRMTHAYIGSTLMLLLVVHTILGIKFGLSLG